GNSIDGVGPSIIGEGIELSIVRRNSGPCEEIECRAACHVGLSWERLHESWIVVGSHANEHTGKRTGLAVVQDERCRAGKRSLFGRRGRAELYIAWRGRSAADRD